MFQNISYVQIISKFKTAHKKFNIFLFFYYDEWSNMINES